MVEEAYDYSRSAWDNALGAVHVLTNICKSQVRNLSVYYFLVHLLLLFYCFFVPSFLHFIQKKKKLKIKKGKQNGQKQLKYLKKTEW